MREGLLILAYLIVKLLHFVVALIFIFIVCVILLNYVFTFVIGVPQIYSYVESSSVCEALCDGSWYLYYYLLNELSEELLEDVSSKEFLAKMDYFWALFCLFAVYTFRWQLESLPFLYVSQYAGRYSIWNSAASFYSNVRYALSEF